jgi:hypothetical protein
MQPNAVRVDRPVGAMSLAVLQASFRRSEGFANEV